MVVVKYVGRFWSSMVPAWAPVRVIFVSTVQSCSFSSALKQFAICPLGFTSDMVSNLFKTVKKRSESLPNAWWFAWTAAMIDKIHARSTHLRACFIGKIIKM
jgi:hypothetical protein